MGKRDSSDMELPGTGMMSSLNKLPVEPHGQARQTNGGQARGTILFRRFALRTAGLVVRHPARPIPLYLNPCDGPRSSTAKAVAFFGRGKMPGMCQVKSITPAQKV